MIAWTVTTRPNHRPEIITAAGAEPSLEKAKQSAAHAVRYALLDARDLAAPNGTPPTYFVAIDGECALVVGLGACRAANYNGVLDSLECFDGSAPPHLLCM